MAVTVYAANNSSIIGNSYNLQFSATFRVTEVLQKSYTVNVVGRTATNLVSILCLVFIADRNIYKKKANKNKMKMKSELNHLLKTKNYKIFMKLKIKKLRRAFIFLPT